MSFNQPLVNLELMFPVKGSLSKLSKENADEYRFHQKSFKKKTFYQKSFKKKTFYQKSFKKKTFYQKSFKKK